MSTNPILNAFVAAGYITTLVFSIATFVARPEVEDSILIPIVMLSLFVLSAAVMSYLFLYQPLMLWCEGKRQEAVRMFLTTTAAFAVITIALAAALRAIS